jgi:hypothetical protein
VGDFWDVFVFRVWAGMGEGYSTGFRSAAAVLRLAHRQHLFTVSTLNDLSLLLLVLTCSDGCALHEEAAAEYLRRSLTPEREWGVLREALPPHLADVQLLGHFGAPRQQAVLNRVARTLYLPSLVRFMARTALTDYDTARAFATPFLAPVLASLDYDEIVADEYLGRLYARVLASRWPSADRWTTPSPPWAARLGPPELAFLDGCLQRLPAADRAVLYLSFYGRLSAPQVAAALRPTVPGVRPQDVVGWLRDSWQTVLNGAPWPGAALRK